MRYINNERGNAAIFLLWLLGIVAIIFLLTVNLVKVFIVKEHANVAVEQAALAGTSVLLDKTKEAVSEFDSKFTLDPLYLADREAQRLADGGKSVSQLIEDKKTLLMSRGHGQGDAYIKAANDILPDRIKRHYFLRQELQHVLNYPGSEFTSAVVQVLDQNQARVEDTEIVLSSDDWRVEVKSTVRFESISDHEYIGEFVKDIPQVGYGPTLKYLENIY
jgi:hypothetical protein